MILMPPGGRRDDVPPTLREGPGLPARGLLGTCRCTTRQDTRGLMDGRWRPGQPNRS